MDPDPEGDPDPAGGPGVDPDQLFLRAVLTVLSEGAPPSVKDPLLVSSLFAQASRRTRGMGIKGTSWKKSAPFLAQLGDCVATREPKKGVLEVVGFNRAQCPEFEPLLDDAELEAATLQASGVYQHTSVQATKKNGPTVQISVRKVRNKNVTMVDGLDDWGFTKARLADLAKEYRRCFSVSVSVAERKGSSGGQRELWSIQVQGKYSQELAKDLEGRGIPRKKISQQVSKKAAK